MMSVNKNPSIIWYVALSILFIFVTNIVFIRLWLETPQDHQYTGIGFEAVADKLVYYSMIEQGRGGRLFMENMHTSEPQRAVLFSPQWWLIGKTANLFGIAPQASYHLYRIVLSILFLIVLYHFISRLFKENTIKIAAFGSVLFAQGLGWFYLVLSPRLSSDQGHWLTTHSSIPADLYVTEMNVLSNFTQSPLFMVSHILIIGIFLLYRLCEDRRNILKLTLLAGATLLLGLVHPYDIVLVGLVVVSYVAIRLVAHRSVNWLPFISVVMPLAAAVAYHVAVLRSEPVLSGWLRQNVAFSPGIAAYAWGLGAVLPLALIGLWVLRKQKKFDAWWILITVWLLVAVVILYLPLDLNRRFANAMFVPFVLIGFRGVEYAISKTRSFYAKSAVVAFVSVLAFSGGIYQTAQAIWHAPVEGERYSYYLNPYTIRMIDEVRGAAQPGDVILSNEDFIAMLVAGFAPVKLYVGHAHQTIDYEKKIQQAQWFFAPSETVDSVERKRVFLLDQAIRYLVVYKPTLSETPLWFEGAPFLEELYSDVAYEVYRVR